ncbi:glycosyltransferase [Gammaproteobacteria bacterium]|nr:glycosyltransferase [Gammaproteobacteria bacterium]
MKKESHYLPNSIAEKTVDAKAMNPYNKGDFNIAVVGSVQKRKGQMKLRSIIQKLNNPRIKFHVIGGLASNNEVDEILESLNTISSVVCHGHKNNIEDYLHFANLAILLSDSEAFPRTVAEYIYYGKAVVSTDVSGATEMVIDGYNGFIVENSSDNFSQIFADKIDLFFTDTDTLDLFSSRSRAIYDDNFSSNLQKASLEKILQNV